MEITITVVRSSLITSILKHSTRTHNQGQQINKSAGTKLTGVTILEQIYRYKIDGCHHFPCVIFLPTSFSCSLSFCWINVAFTLLQPSGGFALIAARIMCGFLLQHKFSKKIRRLTKSKPVTVSDHCGSTCQHGAPETKAAVVVDGVVRLGEQEVSIWVVCTWVSRRKSMITGSIFGLPFSSTNSGKTTSSPARCSL